MIKCLECGKELLVLKHTHFKYKCTGSIKSTKEYHEKYPDAPLTSDSVKSQMAHSESSFKARYGNDIGSEKWKEYCSKLSEKGTLEGFLKKGKTEDEWREFNKSRAVTLENLSKKYGPEEGKKRFESYCELQHKVGKTLDWYIETYGEENGTSRYLEVNKSKGITIKNMIRKYGEVEGRIRYDAWHQATQSRYISNLQRQIIIKIIEIIPTNYIFHEGIFGKEFCSYSERPYMYDFVVTEPIKVCIEINGDFYHANPKKYSDNDIIPIRGSGGKITARQIWENDLNKKNVLESRGYKVYYIWESDWNTDQQSVLEKVKEWLCLEKE